MGLRRPGVTREYEEMPGTNVPKNLRVNNISEGISHPIAQDLEMSSVSVVPDGKRHGSGTIFAVC